MLARAQGRHGQHVERQTVEQIGAKAPGVRFARQVDIGRADHAHIDTDRAVAADALERAVFDDAQDLLLRLQRRVGDFIQEQGAAIGDLEAPDAALRGAGERAGLMTEQFGFQQRVGQ